MGTSAHYNKSTASSRRTQGKSYTAEVKWNPWSKVRLTRANTVSPYDERRNVCQRTSNSNLSCILLHLRLTGKGDYRLLLAAELITQYWLWLPIRLFETRALSDRRSTSVTRKLHQSGSRRRMACAG
jgi:hypothetical protein